MEDPEYSRIEMSNYGKMCMPRMINNITKYERRNQLILRLLCDLSETAGRQTLVLSDRREHLKEIYEYFDKSTVATVGYYIGGMKQSELKASEDKQILLGTYSMSSEGMDIPTLNTLVLASPKSDVEQSIGRILRKQHDTIVPTVYDFCDIFSVFTNQMKNRIAFYKRQQFTIYTSPIVDEVGRKIIEMFPLLHKRTKMEFGKKKAEPKKLSDFSGKCIL